MNGAEVERGLSSTCVCCATNVLLPCCNKIKQGHDTLCKMCFERSEGVMAVYKIEVQLARLLIDMGHQFKIRSKMTYRDESSSSVKITIEYNNKSVVYAVWVAPDYHYFYLSDSEDVRVVKILVEQDEGNHKPGDAVECIDSEIKKLLDDPGNAVAKECYTAQNELRGLIARVLFAGLDGILIRNNCRKDKFQDLQQVKLIDAILCEYKKGIDNNERTLQGTNIVVYVETVILLLVGCIMKVVRV